MLSQNTCPLRQPELLELEDDEPPPEDELDDELLELEDDELLELLDDDPEQVISGNKETSFW